ncbi:unnamed protein product, partial [Symbiodinium pilosum]
RRRGKKALGRTVLRRLARKRRQKLQNQRPWSGEAQKVLPAGSCPKAPTTLKRRLQWKPDTRCRVKLLQRRTMTQACNSCRWSRSSHPAIPCCLCRGSFGVHGPTRNRTAARLATTCPDRMTAK